MSLEQGHKEGYWTRTTAAAGLPDLCDHHQGVNSQTETINTDKRAVTIMVSVQLACRRRG